MMFYFRFRVKDIGRVDSTTKEKDEDKKKIILRQPKIRKGKKCLKPMYHHDC